MTNWSRNFIKRFVGSPSIRAALILLGILVGCFFPFVFGDKTFLESANEVPSVMPYGAWAGKNVPISYLRVHDAGGGGWCSEPWLQLVKNEYLENKTLPVWNPFQGFGTPLAADMQSQVFNPSTVLLALVHSPRTFNWYVLLRLFAAGFFGYLYLRAFVSFVPAVTGGIAAMLAGYYILFLTMPHLSVEVLSTMALWGGERLLSRPRPQSVIIFAFVVFLSLAGGMPESSVLLFLFVFTYLAVRVVTDQTLRFFWGLRLRAIFYSTTAGLGLSAIVILPFRQFLRYSYDVHQYANTGLVTGKVYDVFNFSIVTYLMPLIYGPSGDGIYFCANYIGALGLFLTLVAVGSLKIGRENDDRRLKWLTVFFSLIAIGVVLKRYGILINWVGALPILNLIIFPKYDEPLLSISVAILSAIGLERLLRRQVSPSMQVGALAVCFLCLGAAIIVSRQVLLKDMSLGANNSQMIGWSVMLPCSLLVLTSLLLTLFNSSYTQQNLASRRVAFIAAILSFELLFSYIVPTYYIWNSLPTVRNNPYAGAPYITSLKAKIGLNRVLAADAVLYPAWSSAFGLSDIRNLDAMYYRKYLPFVRNFFQLTPKPLDANELANRFTGAGGIDIKFQDFLQRRLLELSSAKYVVFPLATDLQGDPIISEIASQGNLGLRGNPITDVEEASLVLGGHGRLAIGGQAPFELHYRLRVSEQNTTLHFSYGINPAAFEGACGDGADFLVDAIDASGLRKPLFSSLIDPKNNYSQRAWINGSVDLSPYRGKDIKLVFKVDGGPKGDLCGDWTYWSNFHYIEPQPASPLRLVYRSEVDIYQYDRVVPRAAIYFEPEIRKEELILKGLAQPSFNPFHTVLLSQSQLNQRDIDWLKGMNTGQSADVDSAKIISYTPRKVTIEANANRRSVLVLNDTNFPGWSATVDGAPTKIIDANYLFRGVFLESGKHVVCFSYYPWSVTLGVIISVTTLACLCFYGLVASRRQTAKDDAAEASTALV